LLPLPARSALRQEAAAKEVSFATEPATYDHHDDLESVEPAPGWKALNDIERKIAHLVSQGLTNQQIASQVFRSPHTINYHLRQIFRKLDIHSRVELARLTLLHYSEDSGASEARAAAIEATG
jgi:DNA-binding NarL/FixJ family response regulator